MTISHSNSQTWPRQSLKNEILRDLKQELQIEAAIANAQEFVDKPTFHAADKNVKKVIRELTDVLQELRQDLGVRKKQAMPVEENHFAPMTVVRRPSKVERRPSAKEVSAEELEPYHDPTWLKCIPFILFFLSTATYLAGGAFIFRLLDEKVAARPYYNTLLISFEVMTSIGWGGNLYNIYSRGAKIFCTFYTLFGVPIIHSTFANIGRLGSEAYSWLLPHLAKLPYLETRVKITPEGNEETRVPLKMGYIILIIHQCCGIVVFDMMYYDFGIIGSIYFAIISMATTGLGDLFPNPKSLFEALVIIFFIGLGITILSAVFSATAFYVDQLHFVIIKGWVKKNWGEHWLFKSRPKKNKKKTEKEAVLKNGLATKNGHTNNGFDHGLINGKA